jgi:hypothetical protein
MDVRDLKTLCRLRHYIMNTALSGTKTSAMSTAPNASSSG